MRMRVWGAAALSLVLAACGQADAPQKAGPDPAKGVVNIYSSRHYDADEQIYALFQERTGIQVNRIEAKGDELLARMKAEGDQSPADVLLTVDAGNLWRAEQDKVLQPVATPALTAAVPAHLREPSGLWYAVAKRARVIVYDKAKVQPADVASIEQLADPKLKGLVCARSSGNIYNLSLMAALIERLGQQKAEAWARGVVANFARPPEGGDTDQILAMGAGQCAVALTNHYYWARVLESDGPAEKAAAAKGALSFPDQAGVGTHINITGVGLAAHAPNRDNAVRFMEFLLTPEVQTLLAKANNEYPVVAGAPMENPVLEGFGAFKEDPMALTVLGQRQAEAQKLFDKAGWK
jgi:iron(III) transport system substrate-binding protein